MKRLFIIIMLLIVSISLFPNDKPIPDTFFGLHQHRYLLNDKPWATAPFKTWRIWDAGIVWPEIQPKKDVWDWSLLDKAVKAAEEKNVEIVMNLGLCPAWAAENPKQVAAYGKDYITISPPKNIEDWKTWVRTVAERYKGKIKYWEVWNEPDHPNFYKDSMKKLVVLTKEAYIILKEVDPENKIITPPVTGYPALLPTLDKFLGLGGKKYVDIIGTHFYVWFPGDTPEKAVDVLNLIKSYRKKHNIEDKPIWNTECGFIWKKIDDEERRIGYIARLAVVQWFNGYERVIFYSWDNRHTIQMADKKYQENYVAKSFRETQKWLLGTVVVDMTNFGNNIWVARLKRNDATAIMIWHINDSTPDKKINYTLPEAWRFDKINDLKGTTVNVPENFEISVGVSPLLVYEENFLK